MNQTTIIFYILRVSCAYYVRYYLSQMRYTLSQFIYYIKAGLYIIWCGVHRVGDGGVHALGDTSAFVNPAGQLLLIAINSGLIAECMASA